MHIDVLEQRFAAIGARVKVIRDTRNVSVQIDVSSDRRGEFFELRRGRRQVSYEVIDVDKDERCVLLLVRESADKSKFLCGFDERHWFVAAIPESAAGVSGIVSAKRALQPEAVREAVARIRPRDPFRRRNVAYVRQGEWFFLPHRSLAVDEHDVLRDEPLSRGRGKDHVLELAFRRGGDSVFVNDEHPSGISAAEFVRLTPRQMVNGRWREWVRDPELYAKGSVRHPDHNTIVLHGWHRVLMNTEQNARAMRHVVFLD